MSQLGRLSRQGRVFCLLVGLPSWCRPKAQTYLVVSEVSSCMDIGTEVCLEIRQVRLIVLPCCIKWLKYKRQRWEFFSASSHSG
jgi:hypothetical protein